jgi:hypothetical protein
VGDDDRLIGIFGSGEIYLVCRSAVANNEQGILYVRCQRPDKQRPVFLLHGNVRPAKKDRSQGFGKLDPCKAFSGDGNGNWFSFPLDDPSAKNL